MVVFLRRVAVRFFRVVFLRVDVFRVAMFYLREKNLATEYIRDLTDFQESVH
ncbi:hypothetical protein J2T60_001533 [Natronospira proteinivora]|uniref:Uncharacterized protein n=1 Tax=Natronospira proteinivora TaxID=1807133 RepID=A0ABT1GB33_9GAMM|nr:hypothetical protein [Natronospira proteinivora]